MLISEYLHYGHCSFLAVGTHNTGVDVLLYYLSELADGTRLSISFDIYRREDGWVHPTQLHLLHFVLHRLCRMLKLFFHSRQVDFFAVADFAASLLLLLALFYLLLLLL